MRIHRNLLLSAAVALAVAAPAAAGPGNDPQGAKSQAASTIGYYDCEGDAGYTGTQPSGNHIEFFGDDVMWPPNHKTQTQTIIARGGDGDESVAVYTESTHDEILEDGTEMNGAGNTDPATDAQDAHDADVEASQGSATTTVEMRSERSGRGDGRTYTIDTFATFDGEPCLDGGERDDDEAVNFFVEVPHDMRSDKGAENGKNGNASNPGD